MSGKRQNKSRLLHYNASEKLALIKAVHSSEILWDIKHRYHYDAPTVKKAWDEVAAVLHKDYNECRFAWRSLRDSYRYHQKVAEQKLIKSGIAEPSPENIYESVDWEYAPYMRFYPDVQPMKPKRSNNFGYKDFASTSQIASQISSPTLYSHEDDNSNSKFMVLDDGTDFIDEESECDANISVDETSYYDAIASKKQRTQGQTAFPKRCGTDEVVCINEDEEEDSSDNFILPEINVKYKNNNATKTPKEQLSRNYIDIEPIKLKRNHIRHVRWKGKIHNCSEIKDDAFNKTAEKRRSTQKRKVEEVKGSQKLVTMIDKFLQKQLDMDSATPAQPSLSQANLPALQYWDSLLNSMTPAAARSAARAVTELLHARADSN